MWASFAPSFLKAHLMCFCFSTRASRSENKTGMSWNHSQSQFWESWKANMIQYFLKTSHQTQLSKPAAGILKRNSLIHIWCSRLSFPNIRKSFLIYCSAIFHRMKQYKFSRQMHLKINHKSMSEVFLFLFCWGQKDFRKHRACGENLRVILWLRAWSFTCLLLKHTSIYSKAFSLMCNLKRKLYALNKHYSSSGANKYSIRKLIEPQICDDVLREY